MLAMQTSWMIAAVLIVCSVKGVLSNDRDYEDDSRACNKWYTPPVEHICHNNFPSPDSDKLWIMLFSSHACVECKPLEKPFAKWAKQLKNDPSIRVAVVNCYYAKNYNELCYPRHGVEALPVLRFIENGTFEAPDKKIRHTKQDLNAFITARLEAREPCPQDSHGVSSSVVVPLCRNRFPWKDTATGWMVIYYTKSNAELLMNAAREVSEDLGNTETRSQKRHRLSAIQQKYSFTTMKTPEEGFYGSKPLASIGALCCDCSSTQELFCKELLGSYDVQPPAIEWFENGKRKGFESGAADQMTSIVLMEYTLEHLGVIQFEEEL